MNIYAHFDITEHVVKPARLPQPRQLRAKTSGRNYADLKKYSSDCRQRAMGVMHLFKPVSIVLLMNP